MDAPECDKTHHNDVINSLKDACKDKDLIGTVGDQNQPDDDDSSSSSEETTPKAETHKPTQKEAPATAPAKHTDKETAATAPAKHTEKPATTAAPKPATKSSKPGKPRKPAKPSTVDCDKDHTVTVQDDKTITGVLHVKSCHSGRFVRKQSRCSNVGGKFSTLVNNRCGKLGIKDKFDVKIVKTPGDKTQTSFYYSVQCDKTHHNDVINSLKDACKDKDLIGTVGDQNQPDDDDSSSSSEETTPKAETHKPTQKEAPATAPAKHTDKETAATAPAKHTEKPATTAAPKPATKSSKPGKPRKPAKPSTVDCDKDHTVTVQDDKTITGVLHVKSCHSGRFVRKQSRCSNVGGKFSTLVNNRCGKLGIKDKFDVKIVKTPGDKTQTSFYYSVQCDKTHHNDVINSLKDACKDKDLIGTVGDQNQPDDDDSSSSSEETTPKAETHKPTQKEAPATAPAKHTDKETAATAPAKHTEKPATTAAPKPATKSSKPGKPRKPAKPSTVDCDKDHTVTVQDDKTITGVLHVKSCHSGRFVRKQSRCSNVGGKFSTLVNNRCGKLGIKDKFDVKIVKTPGDKTQTSFYYSVQCDKTHHKDVINSLKDACKDKDLIGTVGDQNQPDDDDSSSSSEETTPKAEAHKPTQKEAPTTTPAKHTDKETAATAPAKHTETPATTAAPKPVNYTR